MNTRETPDISQVLAKIQKPAEVLSKTDTAAEPLPVSGKQKAVKPKKDAAASTENVRGRPKSGRIWKTQKERFAVVKKTIRRKTTDERLAYRAEMKQIKELSQSLKDERKRQNEEKRLRREENKRRRLENERKAEIVQIINNPSKLKRMRKKQLRMIEKRDLANVKVV
ncbi:chromatin assembly factor-I p150 subunit [Anopheles darlingi]|uniref:Coiled-coil domain-containing protein 86 n=1 Tax=Anopheles darlingi TaxID=43151 RepID=W5JUT0_ANODA|nr:coiled-coil domain-containing protein 86 [Anopheles darlingi]XP_049540922.1 coiled-coil domain-containing protein 86 [Anopheles darlingi]ETN68107.1 chromatin assembly factor-I p150 subunit [Anopheles darlingi]